MPERHRHAEPEGARPAAQPAVDLEQARPALDRIALLVQCFAGTPIAQVEIIDGDQVWGTGVSDMPLPAQSPTDAFVVRVAGGERVLWVEDVAKDRRFGGNPLVTGDCAVRFYAGAPIRVSSGASVGAVSIFDRKPRAFDAYLAARLEDLAACVAETWERPLTIREVRQADAGARNDTQTSGLIETAPVALAMTDRDLRIVQASPRWLRERGVDGLDETMEADYAAALRGETIRRERVALALPDGRRGWIRAEVAPWRDADGAIGGLLIANHDITDMVEAVEAAEAANRAKSEFLANMSHEIRTPLNGVMGIASVLGRSNLTAAQREMVELIAVSAQTLESLLTDVLDLARIESGRLDLRDEAFDLAETLRTVAAVFEARAADKGLALKAVISPAAKAQVRGDMIRLRQIVSNLLSNAVKFTEEGRVSLHVEAERSDSALNMRLSVVDTGIGFGVEVGQRLFQRFEQADGSITRRFGGTGLGLAISKSLADAMGGTLTAASTPGKGAVFTLELELPLAEAADAVEADLAEIFEAEPEPPVEVDPWCEPADLSLVEPAAESEAWPPPRILLAEDNPTSRKVAGLILEAIGAQITYVENGEEAVLAAERGGFDLILMDVQMPVMDGLTAIKVIRERERILRRARTPILALTANAMAGDSLASEAAGADGHLTKPIGAEKLIAAIQDVRTRQPTRRAEPRAVAG